MMIEGTGICKHIAHVSHRRNIPIPDRLIEGTGILLNIPRSFQFPEPLNIEFILEAEETFPFRNILLILVTLDTSQLPIG